MEACGVVLMFYFGEILESVAVGHSRKSIESLSEIRCDTANTVYDSGVEKVSAAAV